MGLTTHASVDEFFHEVVQDALDRVALEATEGAECYLVHLLGKFTTARLSNEPLSLKLARANGDPHGDPAERMRALEEVGDTSLYLTGFFAPSLEHKLVDADYYMNLGEAAYRELAHRLSGSSSIADIYYELAARFPRFVDVLAEVRKRVDFASDDVVALYERWLATREEWIEDRLRALGVLVGGGRGSGYLQ